MSELQVALVGTGIAAVLVLWAMRNTREPDYSDVKTRGGQK